MTKALTRLHPPLPAGRDTACAQHGSVLTRQIRWELIAQQYDQMVKSATALRLSTAESESICAGLLAAVPNTPPTKHSKNSGSGENDLRLRLPRLARTQARDPWRTPGGGTPSSSTARTAT
ncbi:Tn3 family transposase [Amycolatopsis taiwanensis]|uniref:Tn3 family transposase n=1 Tax=Amycolatopsis taiwanensis TaxID=342230 RepID=UPI003CCB8C1A